MSISLLRAGLNCSPLGALQSNYRPPTSKSKNLALDSITVVDKVRTRLLISPVGEPLLKFRTYTNLLRALSAAIMGQLYMWKNHNVLHQDVSYGKILLLPAPHYGVLIDFDLAIKLDRTTHASGHRTGTFDFIAADILSGKVKVHNPRHDIESFFYVLLWLCTEWRREKEKDTLVRNKFLGDTLTGHSCFPQRRTPKNPIPMAHIGFQMQVLMSNETQFEFLVGANIDKPASMLKKPLLEWRTLLFPLGRPADFDDIRADHLQLYKQTLEVLERAIEMLEGS
jgi:hypothetical protein